MLRIAVLAKVTLYNTTDKAVTHLFVWKSMQIMLYTSTLKGNPQWVDGLLAKSRTQN